MPLVLHNQFVIIITLCYIIRHLTT